MHEDEMPRDHVDDEGYASAESLERNLKSKSTWLRLLFMLIMMLIFGIGCLVGFLIIVLQFFCVLFTGKTKKEFSQIGHQLALYAQETIDYLTFNIEERPFPFDRDWPRATPDA